MLSVLSKLQELGKGQFWEFRALKEKSTTQRSHVTTHSNRKLLTFEWKGACIPNRSNRGGPSSLVTKTVNLHIVCILHRPQLGITLYGVVIRSELGAVLSCLPHQPPKSNYSIPQVLSVTIINNEASYSTTPCLSQNKEIPLVQSSAIRQTFRTTS